MFKTLPSFLLFVACASQPILAAVVTRTVYYIGSTETPTPTISASLQTPSHTIQGTTRYSVIGAGANGNTQYNMELVLSLWVEDLNGTPQTLVSAPITRTYTLEENASRLAVSIAPSPYSTGVIEDAGMIQTCDLDIPNMKGKCVQIDEVPAGQVKGSDGNFHDRIFTITNSYTAAITPVATFTLTDPPANSATSAATGGATSAVSGSGSAKSSAVKSAMESGIMLCFALVASLSSWFALF